jgi:LPXTG-motif cell wall-anchored protein
MPYGVKASAGVGALVVVLSSFVFAAAAAPANAATTHNVSLAGVSFSPKTLTIAPGDTVIWTNNSGLPHTVTADNGSFDSGSLAPGQAFTHTFATAATVAYHCSFHGAAGGIGMAGTVVVRSATPATTAPPVTSPQNAPPTTAPPATAVPGAPVPSTPATSPTAPAPGVGPAAGATSAASQPELAHTGSDSAAPALLAAVLLVTGVLAVISGRRRSRADRQS